MKHKGFLLFQLILFIIISISLYFKDISHGLITELLILLQLVLIQRYYGWKKMWITLFTWIAILGLFLAYLFLNRSLSGCGQTGGVFPLTLSTMYFLSTLLIQYCKKKLWAGMLLLFTLFIIFPISFKDCSSWNFFCPCSHGFHYLWSDLIKAHHQDIKISTEFKE